MKTLKPQKLLKSLVLGLLLVSPCTHADNDDRIKTIKQQVMIPVVKPKAIKLPSAMSATNSSMQMPMKAEGTDIVMFSEDFSKFTSGSEDAPDMSNIIILEEGYTEGYIMSDYTDMSGWYGSNVYQAGGCCFLSPGSYFAFLMTPAIDLSADNGDFELSFSYRAKSGTTTFHINCQNVVGEKWNTMSITRNCDETWRTDFIPFDGCGGRITYIQFVADEPIFIDNIKITQKNNPEISIPAVINATDVTDTGFTANWMAVNKATSYLLDVFYFSDNQPQYVIKDRETTNTSETVSGLQPGHLYYYSVQATDGTYTSDESDVMVAMNPVMNLDTPEATEATEVSKNGFRANWNSVDNAAYYNLTTVSEYKIPQSGTFVLADENFDNVKRGTIYDPVYNPIGCVFDQYTKYPDWSGYITLLADGMIGLKNYYALDNAPFSSLISPVYKTNATNPGNIKLTISAKMVNATMHTKLNVSLIDAATGNYAGYGKQSVELNQTTTSYDFDLGASNNYYINISFEDPYDPSGLYSTVFIDDIKITQEMKAGTLLTRTYRHDTAYNNSFYVETPDSPDGESFYYYVTAVSKGPVNDINTEKSNMIFVDTNKSIDDVVLSEDFSKFTSGSEDAPDINTNITNDSYIIADYTNTAGWYGIDVYQAGGCCFLSEGGKSIIMTPYIDLTANNGDFDVEFSCKASSGDAIIYVTTQTLGGYTSNYDLMVTYCNDTWQTVKIPFYKQGGLYTFIQFYSTAPIFIDNIKITQKGTAEISIPEIFYATSITETGFTANWLPVKNATAYLLDVFYFNDNQPQYVIKDRKTTSTSSHVSGLRSGCQYYYSVQATNGNHTSGESQIMPAIKPVQDLDTPVATAATEVSKEGFFANWNSVDSAALYNITIASEYKIPQSGTFVLADENFDGVKSGTINEPVYNNNSYLNQYTKYPDWISYLTLLADGMIGLKNYFLLTDNDSHSFISSPKYQTNAANPGNIKLTVSAKMVNCTIGTTLNVSLVDAKTGKDIGNGVQSVELNEEMTSYDFDLGASNNYYVKISFSDPNDLTGLSSMVFIDDIKITQEMEAGTSLIRTYKYATAYNNKLYVETPDSPDGENFYYYVTALSYNTNGIFFSYPSNTIYVDTNTSIGNAVTADGTTITASAGQINISTAEACTVSVFDMSGRTVRQLNAVEGSTSFPIEPGAYIVKCGETVRKVLVR